MLVERWREMSSVERAELADQLSVDVGRMAVAGILMTHPEFTDVQVRHELARRRYGSALADAAYADLLAR